MENIFNVIADILTIIRDNFWQLLLIISMLRTIRYKTYGILLIFIHLLFGYKWYWYAMIVFSAVSVNWLYSDAEASRERRANKIKEERSKDPDYQN